MTLESDAKFEEKAILCFKNNNNLIRIYKTLKNMHFDWSLIHKVYNVCLKKYA